MLLARSEREAPEVDGRVVVRGLGDPSELLDRFLRVRVTTGATYQVGAVAVTAVGVASESEPRRLRPLQLVTGGRDP